MFLNEEPPPCDGILAAFYYWSS